MISLERVRQCRNATHGDERRRIDFKADAGLVLLPVGRPNQGSRRGTIACPVRIEIVGEVDPVLTAEKEETVSVELRVPESEGKNLHRSFRCEVRSAREW